MVRGGFSLCFPISSHCQSAELLCVSLSLQICMMALSAVLVVQMVGREWLLLVGCHQIAVDAMYARCIDDEM